MFSSLLPIFLTVISVWKFVARVNNFPLPLKILFVKFIALFMQFILLCGHFLKILFTHFIIIKKLFFLIDE